MQIFLDDIDYRKFLFVLADILDEYDVECWDFCVMPNHFHLTLKNNFPNLPEAMQHLEGEYAIWWNGRHGRVGHVFQGRYKDQIVQRDRYLATLFRYIALNPVRAGLVGTPEEWRWNAYSTTAGLTTDHGFVSVDRVLAVFEDGSVRGSQLRYIHHIAEAWNNEDNVAKLLRSRSRVVGDSEFRRSVFPPAVRRRERALAGAAEASELAAASPELA